MRFKVLIYIVLFVFSGLSLQARQDSTPVKELKALYSNNKAFKQNVDLMFEHLQDHKDGMKNPWRGKDIDDLYRFMNEWFYFLPNTENGLDRIIEFTMLYYKNPYGMKFIMEEPGRSWGLSFIEERGKYMDSPESAKGIKTWLTNDLIKNDDFVLPVNGFSTFNQFFTRNLRPGAREVDAVTDNSVLVSPADGVINMINNDLRLDSEIPTKAHMTMSLNALLDNSDYAKHFVGGAAMAVFLLPDNYHHYHAPATGLMVESKESVGDRLFGMPDILDMINKGNPGYNKDYSVFEHFRHGYFIIKTEEYGYIGMVAIGLQTIGSVVFEDKFKQVRSGQAKKVYKGDKLGHFAYGGSTVLLMFEKGRLSSQKVQMGQQIGILKK